MTKLSHFAEGLMEAAWLAAVILTPLFFNIYSSRIFEPEKLALLRSLALIILACWIIIWLETGGAHKGTLKQQVADWKSLLRLPLFIPVLAFIVVTIISTIFSVTPAISLWGSYPRLQGAYTTFSYLVIFGALVVHLRRREQVERLIGMIILSSLPVSLYGILQRYGLDPIPWGGDVSQRIASNLGNSIFVAAYLIMVFPLTLLRIVDSFEDLLNENGRPLPDFVRATSYVFIAALQVIAMYFSGSRGPWLGWGASLVVIWLGLSLIWRKRWLTAAGVGLAILAGAFLITLNIPGGPLENLRSRPEFGRLGQLLDAESRTGKVRTLIWQGAADLVTPHEPLEYPDGRQDTWNVLRPLIGYGPEGMYVAYNRFYPPELTLVEKRNASPDRAHNETWDSLVTMGMTGMLAYLLLFGSVLYYGLKWLGLVRSRLQKNLFLIFFLGGGALSTILFVAWQGIAYLGVALPFGMLLGVIGYLLLSSILGWFEPVTTSISRMRAYLLLGLLAAIVAHFMEINFGIAIAVTRTYFWVYTALILLVGYKLPQSGIFQTDQISSERRGLWDTQFEKVIKDANTNIPENELATGSRRQVQRRNKSGGVMDRRKKQRSSQAAEKKWVLSEFHRNMLLLGLLLGILIATLGYNYITNNQRNLSVSTVIWNSMVSTESTGQNSYGVLALMLTTFLIGSAVLAAEYQRSRPPETAKNFFILWSGVLAVSLISAGIYFLIQANNLVTLGGTTAASLADVLRQVRMSEDLLSGFYFYILILLLTIAAVFTTGQVAGQKVSRFLAGVPALIIFALAVTLASSSNLRIVQADVAFKTAELFAKPSSWPVAIAIYQRANELAPNEDYYYLFLGRAYLEHAKSISEPEESNALISQAARDLQKAQALNPLNTDHTANLARLYNLWATTTSDPQLFTQRADLSDKYFQQALMLSPNNARLWDEWAMLHLNVLQQPERAYQYLQTALDLDPSYDWTYALLGDYYSRYAVAQASDAHSKQKALEKAAEMYQTALQKANPENSQLPFSYALALGSIQTQLGLWQAANASFSLALNLASPAEQWRALEALARISIQTGELSKALEYANQALATAPTEAQDRLRQLLAEISG